MARWWIPFLKIGIVIRQAEEGPMRTHLIMNSHRWATLQDIKTEVTRQDRAVKARSGDAMDVDTFTKGSKGASKGSGKYQDSEVVCWYCEKKGHRASECRKKQKDNDSGKSKCSKKGDNKGKNNKKEFTGKCCKCGKIGHRSKDSRSKDTSAFEAGDELAETGCIEMANIDLNALEIGAVTVFPKGVVDDCPMLQTPRQGEELQTSVRQTSDRFGVRERCNSSLKTGLSGT